MVRFIGEDIQVDSTTHYSYRHEITGRRLQRAPNSCLEPTISPSSTNRAHPTRPMTQSTNQPIDLPTTQQICPLIQEVIAAIVTTPMDEPPSKITRSQCRSSHHSSAHPAHTTIPSNILPPTQNVNVENTNAGSSPPYNTPTIQASQPSPHSEDP
eukprot:703217-Pelagomonas_calceolata.AAC.1